MPSLYLLFVTKKREISLISGKITRRPKTSKTASILKWIETNMVKTECYLMRQDNTIHKFSIKLSLSSIGQDKSKLHKQISKILI